MRYLPSLMRLKIGKRKRTAFQSECCGHVKILKSTKLLVTIFIYSPKWQCIKLLERQGFCFYSTMSSPHDLDEVVEEEDIDQYILLMGSAVITFRRQGGENLPNQSRIRLKDGKHEKTNMKKALETSGFQCTAIQS